jgi:hypothetical protein
MKAALSSLGLPILLVLAGCAGANTAVRHVTPGTSPSVELAAGLSVTGGISTRITWSTDFPPNCYVTTASDGAKAFFFGAALGPNEYGLYASLHPFHGPGAYGATAIPAAIGSFDWSKTAVTVFRLTNVGGERWFASAGRFTIDSAETDSATGSLDVDLAPGGPDAQGPIHVTGRWTCLHSGN